MDNKNYNHLVILKNINHVVYGEELKPKSEDNYKYGYELKRTWKSGNKLICFIMFNPSDSSSMKTDLTTKLCISIAERWDYDGIALYNLYALRSSDPSVVENQHKTNDKRKIAKMVGPKNETILDGVMESDQYDKIICAWGNHPQKNHSHIDDFDKRSLNTIQRISKEKLLVLGVTNRQQPNHPRRVPKSITKNDAEKLTQHYIEEIKKS